MRKEILFAAFFALMLISLVFDREILNFFGSMSSLLSPNIFSFMYYISQGVFFIIVVLIGSYLLWDKRKIACFLAGVGFSYVASAVLKLLIQRVRPLSVDLASRSLETFSFPSSHATVYFFIFAFMAGYSEKYKLVFLALAVFFVIASRKFWKFALRHYTSASS